MNYNKYKVRPSAHSRLGSSASASSGVPTVADLERRRREERFATSSSIAPKLITVKEIVQYKGYSIDSKDLNKIGKAVAKYFEKKQGAKSGLKKIEKVEVKPGKIKDFKVTAYHDTPYNRNLINLVIRAYREEKLTDPKDIEEFMKDEIPLRELQGHQQEQELPEMTDAEIDQFLMEF